MVSKLAELGESALSSGKASVSVVLVLLAGYLLRKTERVSKEGESNISKLGEQRMFSLGLPKRGLTLSSSRPRRVPVAGTTFLLPALLFSEIGPLATWDNLRTCELHFGNRGPALRRERRRDQCGRRPRQPAEPRSVPTHSTDRCPISSDTCRWNDVSLQVKTTTTHPVSKWAHHR